MKLLALLLLCFTPFLLPAQVEIDYPHCDCKDIVGQVTPFLSGTYKRICDDKLIESGQFENGEKTGKWESFSLTGEKIREFNYRSGLLDGVVRIFYSDGGIKLEGAFSMNHRMGTWSYYNSRGKILKQGEYEEGKAIGIWKVFNAKGKKEEVVYDFDSGAYLSNNPEVRYFADQEIIQNDNKGEWFILYYPAREDDFENKPIEGYSLANDMMVDHMEVPLDIWDTYLHLNYKARLRFENGALNNIDLERLDTQLDDSPELTFIIITNEMNKLQRVIHSDFSLQLLAFKIKEALWLSGPYISNSEELEIYVPYVVNEIKNRH